MSALWHDHGKPSFLGIAPSFSFHELAEAHEVCPATYAAARFEMMAREFRLGAEYYRHNAALAHDWFERKKSWWAL